MTKISVIGSGYVGLTTALGLVSAGRAIICIDRDEGRVATINRGNSPFYEPEFEENLTALAMHPELFQASADHAHISDSDIVFICVGTPTSPEGGIDLADVRDCAEIIGRQISHCTHKPVIVVRSTVVPGTTEEIVLPVLESSSGKKAGSGFSLAANPEFLQEGKALKSFREPDKIIIGEYDRAAGDALEQLFTGCEAPVIRTTPATAEMIKYASNSFLAAKISFINEIGNICKKAGVDAYEVADAIGLDPRIGRRFLNAGIGFGGSCLPKDLQALIHRAEDLGYRPSLLRAVFETNTKQALYFMELVRSRLGDLKGKTLAVLGIAFKPGTDDIRQAPALSVIASLLQDGASVRVYDPLVKESACSEGSGTITWCGSTQEAIAGSDGVIITTEWEEFRDARLYAGKTVFDGRRALDPLQARQTCDYYEGICW
jgi:UDPglucose 6-dehydrogenase